MCMCCVCALTCVDVNVEARARGRQTFCVYWFILYPILLREGLSLNLELMVLLDWLSSEFTELVFSLLPLLGLQMHASSSPYMGIQTQIITFAQETLY